MDLRNFRFYGAEMITAKILPICVKKTLSRQNSAWSVLISLPRLDVEAFLQRAHPLVRDGVLQWQMGDLHLDCGGLFGGLDEAEGLIPILVRAVDAVLSPDYVFTVVF